MSDQKQAAVVVQHFLRLADGLRLVAGAGNPPSHSLVRLLEDRLDPVLGFLSDTDPGTHIWAGDFVTDWPDVAGAPMELPPVGESQDNRIAIADYVERRRDLFVGRLSRSSREWFVEVEGVLLLHAALGSEEPRCCCCCSGSRPEGPPVLPSLRVYSVVRDAAVLVLLAATLATVLNVGTAWHTSTGALTQGVSALAAGVEAALPDLELSADVRDGLVERIANQEPLLRAELSQPTVAIETPFPVRLVEDSTAAISRQAPEPMDEVHEFTFLMAAEVPFSDDASWTENTYVGGQLCPLEEGTMLQVRCAFRASSGDTISLQTSSNVSRVLITTDTPFRRECSDDNVVPVRSGDATAFLRCT